jgi:hypothetical protein
MEVDSPGPDSEQCCEPEWSEKVTAGKRNFTKLNKRLWTFSSQLVHTHAWIYRMGQKSLTNFIIQLKIINCQVKREINFI